MMLTYRILYIYSHPVAFVQINPFEVDGARREGRNGSPFASQRILAVVLPLISLFSRGGHHKSSSVTEFYFSIQRYERIFETEGYKTL